TTPAGRNSVSGNIVGVGQGLTGIEVDGAASNNTIHANYIGVQADGVTPVTSSPSSDSNGILVKGSSGNLISANVVSANGVGIALVGDGTQNNQVSGNKVGTGATGSGNLGNRRDGIRLVKGASDS